MATVQEEPRTEPQWQEPYHEPRPAPTSQPEVKRSAEFVAGGFSTEAIAAGGAVVLAILGLADVLPIYLASIAVIAVATALLMKAGGVMSRFSQLVAETGGTAGAEVELGTGMSTELVAGAAGIALGVLSLIGVMPFVLLPVAVIVFGGALLFGGGETYRVSRLTTPGRRTAADREIQAVAKSAAGGETLVGVGAIVLGIIALTDPALPLVLSLVGLLCVAGAQVLTGVVESGRMARILRR